MTTKATHKFSKISPWLVPQYHQESVLTAYEITPASGAKVGAVAEVFGNTWICFLYETSAVGSDVVKCKLLPDMKAASRAEAAVFLLSAAK